MGQRTRRRARSGAAKHAAAAGRLAAALDGMIAALGRATATPPGRRSSPRSPRSGTRIRWCRSTAAGSQRRCSEAESERGARPDPRVVGRRRSRSTTTRPATRCPIPSRRPCWRRVLERTLPARARARAGRRNGHRARSRSPPPSSGTHVTGRGPVRRDARACTRQGRRRAALEIDVRARCGGGAARRPVRRGHRAPRAVDDPRPRGRADAPGAPSPRPAGAWCCSRAPGAGRDRSWPRPMHSPRLVERAFGIADHHHATYPDDLPLPLQGLHDPDTVRRRRGRGGVGADPHRASPRRRVGDRAAAALAARTADPPTPLRDHRRRAALRSEGRRDVCRARRRTRASNTSARVASEQRPHLVHRHVATEQPRERGDAVVGQARRRRSRRTTTGRCRS